jgi:hypothetical protein
MIPARRSPHSPRRSTLQVTAMREKGPSTMARIELGDWSLIPGPLENPPPSSVSLDDFAEYPPQVVAETFIAFPGMRLVHDAEPTWWDWKARWQSGDSFFEIDMSLYETEPLSWGGSLVVGHCELDEFLKFRHHVREYLPAVWLHNSACEIHSPESFAVKILAESFWSSQRHHSAEGRGRFGEEA